MKENTTTYKINVQIDNEESTVITADETSLLNSLFFSFLSERDKTTIINATQK